MSDISRRLARLEGRNGPRCHECRLRPASTYVVYPDKERHRDPEPEYCPECGQLIERFILKVVYEGEGVGS